MLADRISSQADGNFLYAFYVTGTLIGYGSLDKVDEKTARALPLPVGGLAGVYEDFLDRQIAGDKKRWAAELRPVLAPLCVALEDGFTIEQLAAIASCLTGRSFTSTMARDVIRDVGQLIDRPHPDGPFRIYHQSFSRFLADRRRNPNWSIDLAEINSAVVRALAPDGQSGTRDWAIASAYVRRHLAAHAAAAGILDNLLLDFGYLLYADLPRLMEVADDASSLPARRRAQLVRLTPEAIDAAPTDRAAMFSVTEVLERLGSTYSTGSWRSSYQARWATAPRARNVYPLKVTRARCAPYAR